MARGAIRNSLIAAALLFLLLAILATLQFRWIGEVRDAERERMRASARAAAETVALDFDREVTRATHFFAEPLRQHDAGGLATRLAAALARWSAEAKFPSLVSEVDVARRDTGAGGWTLERLDAAAARLEPAAWTDDLSAVKQALDAGPRLPPRFPPPDSPGGPPPRMPFRILEDPPILILEAFEGRAPSAGTADVAPPARTAILVRFDREAIVDRILPQLVRRHFGGSSDYDVAVLSRSDPQAVVYRSRADFSSARTRAPDAAVALFAPRPGWDAADRAGSHPPPETDRRSGPPLEGFGGPPPGPASRAVWTLVASHRAGSLDAAVDAARARNLAVSGGILLLLLAAVGMLLRSAHRAERLARQQVEFVAGLTHELRTPLAAIRSAGQNLSDGVVADAGRVQRYGDLIEKEGRRLSGLIETALAQAGIEARGESLRAGAASIPQVVERAIEACRHMAEEHRARIEAAIPPDLPRVAGDEPALRTLLENLISNAIKYGGSGGSVAIDASGGERSVRIAIRDRGPGIPPEDLPRIFEPFYRGSRANGSVGGTGLGLSLVRRIVDALGGRIDVDSRPEEGTAFTVTLPRAPEPAAAPAPVAETQTS